MASVGEGLESEEEEDDAAGRTLGLVARAALGSSGAPVAALQGDFPRRFPVVEVNELKDDGDLFEEDDEFEDGYEDDSDEDDDDEVPGELGRVAPQPELARSGGGQSCFRDGDCGAVGGACRSNGTCGERGKGTGLIK